MLTFARRQPLQTCVINPGKRVKSIDELIQRLVGDAVEISMRFAEDGWNVRVDPDLRENVLLNLAANARDAMHAKGLLRIELDNAVIAPGGDAAYPGMRPGEYVCMAASDNGSGMPPEVAERAFEPFFTTKPEGVGTGLGLSMAYGFVKQSEGYIYIASKVGAGTTIRIFLQRSLEQENTLVSQEKSATTGGNETILLVEDDPEVRATVNGLLSDLGYRVVTAHDAEHALELLPLLSSGVILFTDLVMPGPIDGIELARLARQRFPTMPILLTSGYSYDALKDREQIGRDVYILKKPYRREQLDAAIRQLLLGGHPGKA